MILSAIFLLGCISNTNSTQPTDPKGKEVITPVSIENKKPINDSTEKDQIQKNVLESEEAVRMLKEGRVDILKFKIGDNKQTVIDNMGQPKTEAYFRGGKYMNYGDVWVFYNQFEGEKVTAITFFKGTIFKLKIGESTIDNIKVILGNPESTKDDKWTEVEENYPVASDQIVLNYKIGDNRIHLFTEKGILQVFDIYKPQ